MVLFQTKIDIDHCVIWDLCTNLIAEVNLEEDELMELILYYSEDNIRYIPHAGIKKMLSDLCDKKTK